MGWHAIQPHCRGNLSGWLSPRVVEPLCLHAGPEASTSKLLWELIVGELEATLKGGKNVSVRQHVVGLSFQEALCDSEGSRTGL